LPVELDGKNQRDENSVARQTTEQREALRPLNLSGVQAAQSAVAARNAPVTVPSSGSARPLSPANTPSEMRRSRERRYRPRVRPSFPILPENKREDSERGSERQYQINGTTGLPP